MIGRKWSDARLEAIMGNLLRSGVLLAATVVLAGGVLYIIRHGPESPHYSVFTGEPSDLRQLSGIIGDAIAFKARGIIQLGLLLLILTPVARVALAIFGFAIGRDRMYVVVSTVVLAILLFSLLGGHL